MQKAESRRQKLEGVRQKGGELKSLYVSNQIEYGRVGTFHESDIKKLRYRSNLNPFDLTIHKT